MSFTDTDGENLSENMKQEEKIHIEKTSINLGYARKEFENEKPAFQEKKYIIASNFENVSQESLKQKNYENSFKEEKALMQETIAQSICIKLEIIQCHSCKVLFEEVEDLEDHRLHCHDVKYNRLYDNKLDIQPKPAEKIEETQEICEISTEIDDNRSCFTAIEAIGSKYSDAISKVRIEGSLSEKKYKCTECFYQTDCKAYLILHMDDRHPNINEKKYKCTECSYQTDRKDKIKEHRNVHNNIKPFECDVCKTRFTRKDHLKRHIMNIHSNTKEKNNKCSESSFQSKPKDHLKSHINKDYVIKQFECNICNMTFNWKHGLKRHLMNVHLNTDEKKYKCSKCSYQANRKDNFEAHLNAHYNIKPFECDTCKKGFAKKDSLRKHIKSQH